MKNSLRQIHSHRLKESKFFEEQSEAERRNEEREQEEIMRSKFFMEQINQKGRYRSFNKEKIKPNRCSGKNDC